MAACTGEMPPSLRILGVAIKSPLFLERHVWRSSNVENEVCPTPGKRSIRGTKGPPQRTLSVASPIIARISEMIQNRITMVGSAQPFFS